MKDLLKALKKRAFLWGMLSFLSVFYGLFLFTHAADVPRPSAPAAEESVTQQQRVKEELKEREERFRSTIDADPALFSAIGLGFLLIFSIGLTMDTAIAVRMASGKPILEQEGERAPVPWTPADAAQVFVFLFFSEAALLTAEALLSRFAGVKFTSQDVLLMVNSVLRNTAVIGMVFWIVLARHRLSPASLGLTRAEFWRNTGRGILAYLAALPPLLVVLLAVSAVVKLFSYEPPPQQVVEMYLREEGQGTLIFFTVFVAVLGPIMEEIFFRGFAYSAIRARIGPLKAALLTAGIFALLHASAVALVPIFLLGLFLTYLYERTGSLVPGITAHVVHNLLMVVCTLGFKALSS